MRGRHQEGGSHGVGIDRIFEQRRSVSPEDCPTRRRATSLLWLAALVVGLLLAGSTDHADAQEAGAPNLTAASVQGTLLYVDYDQALDESHTPPLNAYVVRINWQKTTIQSVSVSGQRVTLTLATATIDGDTVTLTYRHKARPTLRSAAGVNAATVRNVAVTVLSPDAQVETFEPEAAVVCSSGCLDPPGISVSRGTANDALFVGWRHVTGATGYEIEYSTTQGDFSSATLVAVTVPDPAPNSLLETISGLTSGTRYYFRAASVNANGRGAWSTDEVRLHPTSVVTIAPNSASVTEGQNAQFTVTLSPTISTSSDVVVQIEQTGDFGVDTSDRTVAISANTASATLSIATIDDSTAEDDGIVKANLKTRPSGYAKGMPNRASMTISDNDGTTQQPDPDPAAAIAAVTSPITEGGDAVFTVTLNPAPSANVDVNYDITTSGSFGVAAATGQTVTVNAGATTATITLATTGDSADEVNGSITVTLVTGTDYTLGAADSATVTVNDDDPPEVSVAAVSSPITEGHAAQFRITLSSDPPGDTSVNFSITAQGNFGVATGDTSISVSGNTAIVSRSTTDDTIGESNGRVTFTLQTGIGYTISASNNSASVTVNDNDEPGARADLDTDNDGLIEVTTLAQLNAIRWDLDGNGRADSNSTAYTTAFGVGSGMGCPSSGCIGYELTAGLDFDTNDDDIVDSNDDYWNAGDGWLPIAKAQNISANAGFRATFEGNGNTISNLFINRTYTNANKWKGYRIGLFGVLGDGATVRDLNLTNVNVTGNEEVGGLAGLLSNGAIEGVSVTGSVSGDTIDVGGLVGYVSRGSVLDSSFDGDVSGTADHTGGLVGYNGGAIRYSEATGTVNVRSTSVDTIGGLAGQNYGSIAASYATNDVTATGALSVGGLVGQNGGQHVKDSGTILACYASGDVSGRGDVGGLVGWNYGSIRFTYSTGNVSKHGSGTSGGREGGLVGWNGWRRHSQDRGPIEDSYWETDDTNLTFGVSYPDDANNNNSADAGEINTLPGHTAVQLQSPTDYTGIYANWNVDVDGDNVADDPWDFGTSGDYPELR